MPKENKPCRSTPLYPASEALKPIYEWVSPFERIWNARLDRLSNYLDALQQDADKGES